ncbi:hypothetical protein [Acinetobacter lwoffii]|uniref:hypothetical protein n=1 Tax=Acinetobacter lwoffii TaxID=28090 RepID=UPI0002CF4F93|nr:hypothetical protein [Acinetobacter lwoffii]ENW30351.1 hypothetical protein F924_00380 [Acinetobacter lwoffii ATCC 9957 = CIP 70.31]
MYVNQSLKSCLVKFLATTAFKAKEFKDIRKMFIEAYPEFKAKKFYQKIYQTVRELQEYGFISVDNSTCTYKYTSTYRSCDLLDYLSNETASCSIQEQLYQDCTRLEEEVDKVKLEIEILAKYMRLYPIIVDKISRCVLDAQMYLKSLQSEITVLNKLIGCISKN